MASLFHKEKYKNLHFFFVYSGLPKGHGTTAKDAFLTIVQTAKKLGVNAFKYINDRVSKKFKCQRYLI